MKHVRTRFCSHVLMSGALLLFIALTFCVALSSPARAGLIAFYPFEGNANDASGNGNDATGEGGVTLTSDGFMGSAFDFDGIDDRVRVPININPGELPQLTMGAWVKTRTTAVGTIISQDNGGFDRSLHIDTRGGATSGDDSVPDWSAFLGTGGLASGVDVVTDEWIFVAVVYDETDGSARLHVNDRVVFGGTAFGDGFEDTLIGRSPGFAANFDGLIDNVFFYDEALSVDRVEEIRRNPELLGSAGPPVSGGDVPPLSGLIAFYPFEGNANDASGNGNDGTAEGGTGLTLNGFMGSAFEFDGIDDRVRVPININPGELPQLTMGAWVKTRTSAVGTIISQDNGGFDRSLHIDTRGGAPFGDDNVPDWSAFLGTGAVASGVDATATDEWVFVAVVYNETTHSARLHVNDRVVFGGTAFGDGFEDTLIGRSPGFAANFDGFIDNVFFFDEALSVERVELIRRNPGILSGEDAPVAGGDDGPTGGSCDDDFDAGFAAGRRSCIANPSRLIVKDISTGYRQSTDLLLAFGSSDDDWTLTAAPSGVSTGVASVTNPNPLWFNPEPDAHWIGPPDLRDARTQDSPVGSYTFELTFNIPSLDDQLFSIEGLYQSDNALVEIELNGNVLVSGGGNIFTGFEGPFFSDDQSIFRLGTNRLTATVLNQLRPGEPNSQGPVALVMSGAVTATPVSAGGDGGTMSGDDRFQEGFDDGFAAGQRACAANPASCGIRTADGGTTGGTGDGSGATFTSTTGVLHIPSVLVDTPLGNIDVPDVELTLSSSGPPIEFILTNP